jgi:hypothetical protein
VAAKLINYFSAWYSCNLYDTSVTTPVRRTFSRARGVFIFVRNFSRGIFLRESLSKVAAAAARLVTKWQISVIRVMLSMDTWTVSHSDF